MYFFSLIPLDFSRKETVGLWVGAEGRILCAFLSEGKIVLGITFSSSAVPFSGVDEAVADFESAFKLTLKL